MAMQRVIWTLLVASISLVAAADDQQAQLTYGGPRLQPELAGTTYYLKATRRTPDRGDGITLLQLAQSTSAPLPTADKKHQNKQQPAAGEDAFGWDMVALGRPGQLPGIFNGSTIKAPNNTQPGVTPGHKKAASAPKGKLSTLFKASVQDFNSLGSKVELSFDGLSAVTQRYGVDNVGVANPEAINRLEVEPANPSLAVGHGFVMETASNTLRIYDQDSGRPLMPPVSTNTFLGLAPEADRSTFQWGTLCTAPQSAYDAHLKRWFVTVSTVVNEGTAPAPPTAVASYLDIAVSDGPDPTGSWSYYRIPSNNDGQNGTPNFGCNSGACRQYVPRLAVWDAALVVVTRELSLNGFGDYGNNVYAIDKGALVQHHLEATTALVRTYKDGKTFDGLLAATQPEPCRQRNTHLLATPIGRNSGEAQSTLQLLSLEGTHSLDRREPDVELVWVEKAVALDIQYVVPPLATQKDGPNPLGDTRYGRDVPPPLVSADVVLGASMASVVFADDKLFSVWSSGVQSDGQDVVGVAWAVIDPFAPRAAKQAGVLGVGGGNSLIYPSLAVRSDCNGVLAITVIGPGYYPSAAYGVFEGGELGQLALAAEGKGVVDGMSQFGNGINVFGVTAAAVLDAHGAFWLSTQYIAQSCTVEEYSNDFTCGFTRTRGFNWATRVSKVRLHGRHYF